MELSRWLALASMPLWMITMNAAQAQAQRCEAASGPQQVLLVELYTSEGCNSCPPADRWLSTLKGRPDVLAAAFHVDYWDRLGWKDRFGSPQFTQRQARQQASSGAGFSYTPQVLVNGRDWRRWPGLPAPGSTAAVQIRLQREDDQQVAVQVTPLAGAPDRLAAWWARLEDGHVSAVKAGENAGVTLLHDHVVRGYGLLPAWAAAPQHWRLDAPRLGEGGRAARLLLVVTDAATGAPLQAAQLGC
ncbi:DUF1223 domain-containing protein [Aquabacterium sp.]|uniref:DUF1223 domain-containing protein n=1 Tax=Aquabacterium sp. TaxID=1872578 RepID=UPI003782FA97